MDDCAICNSPRGEHEPRVLGCPVGTRADGGVLFGPTRFMPQRIKDGEGMHQIIVTEAVCPRCVCGFSPDSPTQDMEGLWRRAIAHVDAHGTDTWPLSCDCLCGECCASISPEMHCRSRRCVDGMSARVA